MTLASAGSVDPAQLGVASVTVLLLMAAVVALWRDNLSLRREHREDQKVVIPALTDATTAVAAATRVLQDFSRFTDRLLELLEQLRRERGQ